MSRVSCPSNENPENYFFFFKLFFFPNFLKKNFLRIIITWTKILDMGVFKYLMGSPDCKDLKKNICGKVFFWVPELGGFGGVNDL